MKSLATFIHELSQIVRRCLQAAIEMFLCLARAALGIISLGNKTCVFGKFIFGIF
jgi:hypothetical protein